MLPLKLLVQLHSTYILFGHLKPTLILALEMHKLLFLHVSLIYSTWSLEILALIIMSFKENKISRRVTKKLKGTDVDSRDSLHRSDAKVTVDNIRGRMNYQLVNQPGEYAHSEFTSYFYGNTGNIEPLCSLTSHGLTSSTVPTYPAVGLRWNPCVETSSIENFATDFGEQIKYNCRCDNCNSKVCPSRLSSLSTLKPSIYKSNIMTFEDKSTMTIKLKDANCECPSIASIPRQSRVSIDTADTNIKNNQPHLRLHEYPERCTPTPILKKQNDFICKPHWCYRQKEDFNLPDVAERDIEICKSIDENHKSKSFGSFFKLKKKEECKENTQTRKVLYNEGISDTVANKYLTSSIRVPSPRNIKNLGKTSQVSVSSKSVSRDRSYNNRDSKIPFAHRRGSKYHHLCKKAFSKHLFEIDTDEIRRLTASPDIVSKIIKNPIKYQKVPSIKLPKRVLTSERDIELYIDKAKIEIANGKQSI